MSSNSDPQLAPPGAGLPAIELWVARLLFALKRLRGNRETFVAKFEQERAAIRALGAGLKTALDEVERLRALIDNPGDLDLTFSTTGLDKMHLAHAETVKVTITSHTIRDHLRAKLEAPND